MCIISYCASPLCGVQPHPHLNCVNQSWPLTAEKVFDKFQKVKTGYLCKLSYSAKLKLLTSMVR